MTTEEMSKIIEAAADELLKTVQKIRNWQFIAHLIFFSTAIISLFTKDYVLYITTIVALIAKASAFVLSLFANSRNKLGHSLKRVSMLTKAYKMNGEYFDVGYLLSKIPPKIHRVAVEALKSKKDDSSDKYTSPEEEAGTKLLRWMIQENAFFNSVLYEACAERAVRILLIFTSLFLLFSLLIIPSTDGEIEYLFFRILLIILSLTILYDQVEQWSNWRYASRIMLDLENELARFKTVPDHRILLLFSNYQVVICNTPVIKFKIYNDNREKLNAGWQQRIAMLNQEWSVGTRNNQ